TARCPTPLYHPPLHDALPISLRPSEIDGIGAGSVGLADGASPSDTAAGEDGELLRKVVAAALGGERAGGTPELSRHHDQRRVQRSEEHTSELQSLRHLVCRRL